MRPTPRMVWWTAGLLLALTLVAVVVTVRQDPVADVPDPPVSTGIFLSVVPVAGDLPGGRRQTLETAMADVEAAADQGAAGIQVTADLRWLCTTPQCDTAPLEPVVARAGELGLAVNLHVNSTPVWMDERGRWFGPEGADALRWADLFAQLVARFGTDVAGYEVWNEPNYEPFWQQGPDPAAYADLLKAVWEAVEAVEPDAQIIGGVLSNNDLGYMSRLTAALVERGGNAENRFFYDQLGVHPYAGDESRGFDPGRSAGSADVQTATGTKDMTFRGIERLRAQVAEDEGIWRDVVVGEFGYSTTPGTFYFVPEPRRAEYLTEALRLAASWEWLRGFTVYTTLDDPDDGFSIAGTESEVALREAMTGRRD
ncbi:hypothetical protein [Blastococcus aurantiacus]|uniref:hypothetical protein n=1 Tax=Blastococcus aurantiacus TaxID=1550231 RepID=UPI00115FBFB9|nr:hypothetical protein [Blastococcus aurantiacus]